MEQLRMYPYCSDCLREGRRVKARDVHHPIRHNGDEGLFKTIEHVPDNSKCKRHHSRKTASEVHLGQRG
jgi:hypothetical protein